MKLFFFAKQPVYYMLIQDWKLPMFQNLFYNNNNNNYLKKKCFFIYSIKTHLL